MGQKAKALTGLLIIITFISLLLAAGAGYVLKQEMDKRKALEQRLQSNESMKADLDKNLQQTKQEVERLMAKLSDGDSQIANLTKELQTEKSNSEKLISDVGNLESQMKQEKIAKEDLSKQLEKAKQDLATKEKEFKSITDTKSELEAKLKDLEAKSQHESVQLEKIVVKQGVAASSLEGKIVSVNREYDFVIVDLGKKDGIQIGDILTVYDKSEPAAKIKVEKVYEALCAANFLPQTQKDKIKEGLRVSRP